MDDAFSFTRPGKLDSEFAGEIVCRQETHKIATWAISQGAEFKTNFAAKDFLSLVEKPNLFLIHGVYMHKCIYELHYSVLF